MSSTPPARRRVILLRHGQTDWNLQGRWQGRADVPLNAEGIHQAERAAQILVRDSSIGTIVHSSAKRAAQTAAVVKSAFDLAGRPLPMSADDRLVEIDVGEWSGLTTAQVAEQYPDQHHAIESGEDLPRGLTGESVEQATARVRAAFDELVSRHDPKQTLLIVMHGAVIRGLAGALTSIEAFNDRAIIGSLDNGHWAEVGADAATASPEHWRLTRWNAGY